MKWFRKATLYVSVFCALLGGCGTPPIPSQISEREYALYSEWVNHRFGKNPPKALYFYSETMPFDTADDRCVDRAYQGDRTARNMIQQQRALGTRKYPLDLISGHHDFRVEWKYEEIDNPPVDPQFGYDAIHFSRVAFNRAGDEALFSMFDSCAAGACGQGGDILARRVQGHWTFRGACIWVS